MVKSYLNLHTERHQKNTLFRSQFCEPSIKTRLAFKRGQRSFSAGTLMPRQSNLKKSVPPMASQSTSGFHSSKKKLILDVKYGNEHDSHTVTGINDGFIVGHIPILSPGAIGIYRCHR